MKANLINELQQRLNPVKCWGDVVRHFGSELSIMLALFFFTQLVWWGGLRVMDRVLIIVGAVHDRTVCKRE